jgi:hypothetical protein
MTKFLALIFTFISLNCYSFNDEKIMAAGIKINPQGKKLYFSFSQKNSLSEFKPKLNFELPILQKNKIAYRGYKNVEGFENKGPKIQRNLSIGIISAGILVLAAGTLTVAKIVNAIDD